MAWSFNGTTEFLRIASTLGLVEPFSFACWCNPTSRAVDQTMMALSDGGGPGDAHYLIFRQASDFLGCASVDQSVAAGESLTASAFAAGWNHACGRWVSSSERRSYLNGASTTDNVTNCGPDSLSEVHVGRYSVLGGYFGGEVQSAAAWSASLTAAEVAGLAIGFSPRRIRPQSLVFYMPLVRAAFDWKGNALDTATGAAADHHRAYGI